MISFSELITYGPYDCGARLKGGEEQCCYDEEGYWIETHFLVHANSLTRAALRIRCAVRCAIRRMTGCTNSLLISLINTVHQDRHFCMLFNNAAAYDYHYVNGQWEDSNVMWYKTKSKETGISIPDLYFLHSDRFWYTSMEYNKKRRDNCFLRFPSLAVYFRSIANTCV